MDTQIVTDTIDKLKEFSKKHGKIIIVGVILIIVIYATYLYTPNRRIKSRIDHVTNNLVYDKEKEQIDFCGIDNDISDTLRSSIRFDSNNFNIQFLNDNINLYDLGITSEYLLDIHNSNGNDGVYKINNVTSSNSISLLNDPKIKVSNTSPNCEITYFRPSSNQNVYKHKKLCEYKIASAYRPYLVGHQKADYCSIEMIQRVLYFGARYLDLEIFNKELSNDTEPVITSGYRKPSLKLSLNSLKCDQVFDLIKKVAFSEEFLNNYNDPLFIFLDLKTNGNVKTLDKLYDIIIKYFGNRLLGKEYNHTNLASVTLCKLKGKVIIMTSDGYQDSKLDKIINCSTDKPYLQRITYYELRNHNKINKPKFKVMSNNVRFTHNLNSNVTFDDDKINLINNGLVKGNVVQISGSNKIQNNSGEYYFKIKQVTEKSIVFESPVKFVDDYGSNITLIGYDSKMLNTNSSLEEYNKDFLTIVIPDDALWSSNYSYKNCHKKGCQFVSMNYQNLDKYIKSYFNLFETRSFQYKPNELIHDIELPKTKSMNSLVPKLREKNKDYNIDYSFSKYIGKYVIMNPYKNNNLRVINDNRVMRVSLNYSTASSYVQIVKALNEDTGLVSFKNNDRYLCRSDCCCYLYFSLPPDENTNISLETINKFKMNASFLPLLPMYPMKNYSSFGMIKTIDLPDGQSEDIIYHLRYRNYLSTKTKLYNKTTRQYKVKIVLDANTSTTSTTNPTMLSVSDSWNTRIAILKPEKYRNFLPLGDLAIPYKNLKLLNPEDPTSPLNPYQEFGSHLVSGAVSHPANYELLWDNKYFVESNTNPTLDNNSKLSIWKPIPNDGYTAVGVVFQLGYTKPSIKEIYCVANDYLTESTINEEPLWYHPESQLIFWQNTLNTYVAPNNIITVATGSLSDGTAVIQPPNNIDFKVYDLITKELDYSDRLYLDKKKYYEKEDKVCFNFKITDTSIVKDSGSFVYDYLMDIKNDDGKLISYTRNSNGSRMCVALPQPYWTSFYQEVDDDDDSNLKYDKNNITKIQAETCKERDYFGTNWTYYSNDDSIRLEGNKDFCLTTNKITSDKDDVDNYMYLSKCSNDLENQMFKLDNDNIKVFTNTGYDPNVCVTHTPTNKLRLEECGDTKYTALWNTSKGVNRYDSCTKLGAENYLKDYVNMRTCPDKSYYVLYIDGIVKHHEECSMAQAEKKMNSIKSKYPGGVGISKNGELLRIERSLSNNLTAAKKIMTSYAQSLKDKESECTNCMIPGRIICENNTMQSSTMNFLGTPQQEEELISKCSNLKPDSSFKCDREYRQRFTNTIVPYDFCLDNFNEVYIYFHKNGQHLLANQITPYLLDNEATPPYINLSRGSASNLPSGEFQTPVDNLLGEVYDSDNYHMFIKGVISQMSGDNSQYYQVTFDKTKVNLPSIKVLKFSNDIILNYSAPYSMFEIGSKVLCRFEITDSDDDYDDTSIGFVSRDENGTNHKNIYGTHVKYLAVVVDKLKNNRLKIMFSINSYESNKKLQSIADEKRRPFMTSNKERIVPFSECTLLRKAPICNA